MKRNRMKPLFSMMGMAAVCLAAGCNWLIPFMFIGEHKRSVPPEFDKLVGKRVAVLVWTEPVTLFDYPHVRLELATYVGDKIAAGVTDCDVVDPELVEEFLEKNFDAMVAPAKVANEFNADYVVYIEVIDFQIRDASAPDLVRAHVNASISVSDLRADPDETSQFFLKPVQIRCPEHQPLVMSSRNALLVRQQAYEKFSEVVARKFYKHMIDL